VSAPGPLRRLPQFWFWAIMSRYLSGRISQKRNFKYRFVSLLSFSNNFRSTRPQKVGNTIRICRHTWTTSAAMLARMVSLCRWPSPSTDKSHRVSIIPVFAGGHSSSFICHGKLREWRLPSSRGRDWARQAAPQVSIGANSPSLGVADGLRSSSCWKINISMRTMFECAVCSSVLHVLWSCLLFPHTQPHSLMLSLQLSGYIHRSNNYTKTFGARSSEMLFSTYLEFRTNSAVLQEIIWPMFRMCFIIAVKLIRPANIPNALLNKRAQWLQECPRAYTRRSLNSQQT
jgi:hypothetical protein